MPARVPVLQSSLREWIWNSSASSQRGASCAAHTEGTAKDPGRSRPQRGAGTSSLQLQIVAGCVDLAGIKKTRPATEKRPPGGLFCCCLPHSRQRQEQDEHRAANIQRGVFVYSSNGGAEGNRTPVRKQLGKNFSGCSLLFTFPYPGGNKHPTGLGSFIMRGAGKAYRTHGLHFDHTRARLVDLPGRMGA